MFSKRQTDRKPCSHYFSRIDLGSTCSIFQILSIGGFFKQKWAEDSPQSQAEPSRASPSATPRDVTSPTVCKVSYKGIASLGDSAIPKRSDLIKVGPLVYRNEVRWVVQLLGFFVGLSSICYLGIYPHVPKISMIVFFRVIYLLCIYSIVHGDGDCKFQTSPGHWAALGWTRHLRSSYRFALWRSFPWQKTQKPPSMQSDRRLAALALAPWASIGEYTLW